MNEQQSKTPLQTGGGKGYLRIATEEAFAPPEMMSLYQEVLDGPDPDPGFVSLMGFYMRSPSERAKFIFQRLQDLGSCVWPTWMPVASTSR